MEAAFGCHLTVSKGKLRKSRRNFYSWCPPPRRPTAATNRGVEPLNLIVWAKTHAGMGSLNRPRHELLPPFKKRATRRMSIMSNWASAAGGAQTYEPIPAPHRSARTPATGFMIIRWSSRPRCSRASFLI
jgi:hypothetical protein